MFILYIPVLLCSFHVYCADRVSLRYGEWIKDHEETLVSPGRKFELGFFSPTRSSGDKRYVGIWYKCDKRTLGESCNTTDTIVNLTDSGNLVLYGYSYEYEPTVRNCEPCGTNMIPYPLSASSNCGDPMYFSFNCNTTSGQIVLQLIDFVQICRWCLKPLFVQLQVGLWWLNVLGWNDVEIVWEPPLEPICNLSTDCKDWPHSTCKSASDGKRRCLCTKSFRWDGTKLSCTQGLC
nr:wall-associated receptor kinase-like 15 [Quercus suber]